MSAPLADGISRCWQSGWHAYSAGPCFDSREKAVAYRDLLDFNGKFWAAPGEHLAMKPAGWVNQKYLAGGE